MVMKNYTVAMLIANLFFIPPNSYILGMGTAVEKTSSDAATAQNTKQAQEKTASDSKKIHELFKDPQNYKNLKEDVKRVMEKDFPDDSFFESEKEIQEMVDKGIKDFNLNQTVLVFKTESSDLRESKAAVVPVTGKYINEMPANFYAIVYKSWYYTLPDGTHEDLNPYVTKWILYHELAHVYNERFDITTVLDKMYEEISADILACKKLIAVGEIKAVIHWILDEYFSFSRLEYKPDLVHPAPLTRLYIATQELARAKVVLDQKMFDEINNDLNKEKNLFKVVKMPFWKLFYEEHGLLLNDCGKNIKHSQTVNEQCEDR